MAGLLDALYETNFMELESTRDTPRITYMEAPDGDDQVHIAKPTDALNSLSLQLRVRDKADSLKEKILQGWKYGGWDDSLLPADKGLNWFVPKGDGSSLLFKVRQVIGCHMKEMLLNVVYSSSMDNTTPQFPINVLIINYTKITVKQCRGDWHTFNEDAEWQSIISSV